MSNNFISETDLIKMCIKGDRRYQNALYSRFAPKMMAVCFRYSRNLQDAEDTLMEGFVKVFENIAQFKQEGSFEGWIRRIMVNTAIAKFKKNNPFGIIINIEKIHYSITSDENIYDQLGAKVLINMIQQLPPAYQMVFNLYSFEGLKHREIAEQLGISEGTSKSNLSDARNLLKKMINKTNQIELAAIGN
jgi:RNA polymerase sigma-70 factor (ECF subfamily)